MSAVQWLSERIHQPWNFMRWFRLLIGIYLVYEGIAAHDSLPGLFGAFLLYQAISATGCCGSGLSCSGDFETTDKEVKNQIEYEEVTEKTA